MCDLRNRASDLFAHKIQSNASDCAPLAKPRSSVTICFYGGFIVKLYHLQMHDNCDCASAIAIRMNIILCHSKADEKVFDDRSQTIHVIAVGWLFLATSEIKKLM